jgi:DNA primase
MGEVKLRGQYLPVDIREELSEYDWIRPRWSETKLIAASPFRHDNTPSFFVNLETGGWSDAGAFDSDYESGNLAKLLAFLRDETYEEACEYLIERYGIREYDNSVHISLPNVEIKGELCKKSLTEDVLLRYNYRHSYLEGRGISEKVQKFLGVGYSKQNGAITIPWRHADGSLANLKYRKVAGKIFWYERGASPIRTLVYGIDKVYKHKLRTVVICEAEIDAMSWWTSGQIPAIALGGSNVTDVQLELIRKSPIERLILAMDNDKQGRKMRDKLVNRLTGYVELAEVAIPTEYKDANEALTNGVNLKSLHTVPVRFNLDNLFDRYA